MEAVRRTKPSLERLLRPKSIAVVGGGNWCEAVIRANLEGGFSGAIWPVHPTKTSIQGVNCYNSVTGLPSSPDASFIGVNRNATVGIVNQLAHLGAGGAVCFASGFREASAEDQSG